MQSPQQGYMSANRPPRGGGSSSEQYTTQGPRDSRRDDRYGSCREGRVDDVRESSGNERRSHHSRQEDRYTEYPADRPFINDDYRRDPNKPIKAFPESNRQAVMSALKGLQDKIRHLEMERCTAEDNLKHLADETSRVRDILSPTNGMENAAPLIPSDSPYTMTPPSPAPHEQSASAPATPSYGSRHQANFTMQNNDVHEKLSSAEQRCQLLERQLEHMRNMVQGAEKKVTHTTTRAQLLQQQRDEEDNDDIKRRLAKINELEREHLKLTATQAMAENKIRNLEQKVREERLQRRRMQDKAAELETKAESDRILGSSNAPKQTKKVKKKVKKRPVSARANSKTRSSSAPARRRAGGEEHYKLNMAEIPFVAGKSTTPSHSLPANFQEVLSLMKAHNTVLCKSPRQHQRPGPWNQLTSNTIAMATAGGGGGGGGSDGGSDASSGIGSSGSGTGGALVQHKNSNNKTSAAAHSDISQLLLHLQDEFGAMSFEHRELARQVQECTYDNPRLRDDLERELEALVERMEDKGNQIALLRRHQNTLLDREENQRKNKKSSSHKTHHQVAGEVQVTTTIRTKGNAVARPATGPPFSAIVGGSKAQASLNLLKDLKKIQCTLRKDDISWDD